VTSYKCKKDRHYANECDKEDTVQTSNKKGSSFLVLSKNQGQFSDVEEEEEEDEVDEEDEEEYYHNDDT